MAAADPGALSPDSLTLLAGMALVTEGLRSFEVRNLQTDLYSLGLLEAGGSFVGVKRELEHWLEQGWLRQERTLYADAAFVVVPEQRLPLILALRAAPPSRLTALAAHLYDGAPGRYSGELGPRAHRWLLATVSEKPALIREAEADLLPVLDDVTERADFEFSTRAGTRFGLGLRYALARHTWSAADAVVRAGILHLLAYHTVMTGTATVTLAEAVVNQSPEPRVRRAALEWHCVTALVAGDFALVDALATQGSESVDASATVAGAHLLAHFLRGDEKGALGQLDALLARLAEARGTKKESFVAGPLFPWLAALALGRERGVVSKVKSFAAEWCRALAPSALVLWAVFRHQGKAGALALVEEDLTKADVPTPLDRTLMNLGGLWNGMTRGGGSGVFSEGYSLFLERGAHWYQLEVARTAEKLTHPPGDWGRLVAAERSALGLVSPFADLIGVGAGWEAPLKRLAELKFDKPAAAPAESKEVLAWLFDPERVEVEPVVRKLLRGGDWSAPKKATLSRLVKGDHPAIQAEDRVVLKALKPGYYGWEWDHKRAIEALVGHPRVFLAADPALAVGLEGVEVELRVEEGPGGLRFSLSAPLDSTEAVLSKVDATHWQVLLATERLKKVGEVVGRGLVVPPEARERVVEVLGNLAAGIQVRSPLLKENVQAVTVEADARPVLLLTVRDEGFVLEVHVRPLGPRTSLLRPGEGPLLVHAKIGPQLLTATRDLSAERESWAQVLLHCPDLDAALGGARSLLVEDPLDGLGLLAELREVADKVTMEWPAGGRILLHRKVGPGALKLKLARERQWFSVDGTVALDEQLVVDFRQLLAQGTPGRFVRLDDGGWIELEAQLLRQLQYLSSVGETTAKHLRVSPLVLAGSELLLDETLTTAPPEIDRWRADWKLGISPDLSLPASLTAELRPYQVDGYRWLVRLGEVGAGACLADDMGLGKTIQTIALIAYRAQRGPVLVLAPTSVAPNWVAEIRRFDRALEPVLFSGGSRSDRRAVVAALGPGQVLIATYGLLVTEDELLASREWNVVVLDEAQAVKNAQSQRAKAVLKLKAGFRIAATGTPLQNHLGELWTLFEFLNPGLLGTKTQFTDRFWSPIENQNDQTARRGLQTLIRPFLLRRTKNQVLTELPEKTETTLAVDLGPGEREFYEALRQRAVEQMTQAIDIDAMDQRILVLTHLMKLRRACCHPVLAGGPDAPTSSKLEVLEELLESLIDNGHRTLVFSQFTDHLALIRTRLEARGWAYESLDGSTPAKDRGALVARFQTGTAPVFLISLQAGGTGLNLTAADYVIHMDPWWNPAVEDQASDRAHRLGQTRPVTIYRLVARDTIEERIVALHRTKRDLADALLEGTEAAGRLGTQELLALMAGD